MIGWSSSCRPARVEELVASGAAERFDPGHGRIQKEWLSMRSESADDWLAMAIESEVFVGRSERKAG